MQGEINIWDICYSLSVASNFVVNLKPFASFNIVI